MALIPSLGIYLYFLVKTNPETPIPDPSLHPKRAFLYMSAVLKSQ